MRLGRTLIYVALILIVALALYYVLVVNGTGAGDDAVKGPTRSVVALSVSVKTGEQVTVDKLIIKLIPEDEFSEMMFTDPVQLVGLYSRGAYQTGQVISTTMVVADPTLLLSEMFSNHSAIIPAGMVAFPIPINRFSGVAYGITRGDKINLIATMAFVDLDQNFQTELPNYTGAVIAPGPNAIITQNSEHVLDNVDETGVIPPYSSSQIFSETGFQNLVAQTATGEFVSPQGYVDYDSALGQPLYVLPSEASQRPRIVSQTVLSNRIILNVGDFDLVDENGNVVDLYPVTYDETGAPIEELRYPDLVTLIVTPQEAVTLNFLIYSGAQLTLALRSPSDGDVVETNSVSLKYFMNTYSIQVPDKLNYGLTPSVDELIPPELPNGMH